jgi:hypothetical protein
MFGNIYWQQLIGTAMGTPPACVLAMLYYVMSWKCQSTFGNTLPCTNDTSTMALSWVNSFGSLRWIFTNLSWKINYLDIPVRLHGNNTIQTTLFEKPLKLYLYLPPHSPPES